MIEDTSKGLLGLFLWSFVPNFFSSILLNQYHKIRYPNPSTRPKKGTPKYRKHYISAYSTVMFAYFAYCVGQSLYDLPTNYYRKIGIDRLRVEQDLKGRFRTLVMQLHPDKVPNADPAKFLEVKHTYEALENLEARTAYEIYGEQVLNSSSASSKKNKNTRINLRDIFESAFINWIVYYSGSLIILLILALMSRTTGIYWRLVGLLLCASVELYTMTSPSYTLSLDSSLKIFGLEYFLSPFTVHEKIMIFKSIIINLSMVATQLLNLYEKPAKPVAEEILELTKELEKMISGPLKGLSEDSIAEIGEVLEKDEVMAKNFKNSIGKFISKQEK